MSGLPRSIEEIHRQALLKRDPHGFLLKAIEDTKRRIDACFPADRPKIKARLKEPRP